MYASPTRSLMRFEADSSGEPQPVFAEGHEHEGMEDCIARMREGILEKVRELKEAGAQVWEDEAFGIISRLLRKPTDDELLYLGGMEHADGFGPICHKRPIGCPARESYLAQPARLRFDYEQAFWRCAFYRQLTVWEKLLLRCIAPFTGFSRG